MTSEDTPPLPRSPLKIAGLLLLGLVLFGGFIALGTWQVHRLGWKLDLIARVDARVHADPVAAPGEGAWARIGKDRSEYLHVRVTGRFLSNANTLVHTSTRKGRGFWVMTPLWTQRGFIVLINRGFLDANEKGAPSGKVPPPPGRITLTGLLRISQPGGGLFRSNHPAQGRWYSRDVAAIAASDHLPADQVAPYFIDADASSEPGKPPVGGMTVIHFRNAHLEYAITWYALAVLVAIAAFIVIRFERRNRRYHAGLDTGSSGV